MKSPMKESPMHEVANKGVNEGVSSSSPPKTPFD